MWTNLLIQTEVCSISHFYPKGIGDKHTDFWILQIWVQTLVLPLSKLVTLGVPPDCSEPQFPQMYNRDKNTYLIKQ